MPDVLTIDHPAWEVDETGRATRLVRSGAGLWCASAEQDSVALSCLQGEEDSKPTIILTDPANLPDTVPAALRHPLQELRTTHRLANPWLWDALSLAILRKVIRAAQARALYRRWCTAYGITLNTPSGPRSIAPTPERVLDLSDNAFTKVGAKFHRPTLQAAAAAYREHGATWATLPPADLITALTSIKGVGPWVARACTADFSGDFSHYPHGDLAVRTWANDIAPSHPWPAADTPFEQYWRRLAGSKGPHTLTLTTLTWGSHTRLP
ncbi:hypothetical protein [Streptomyces noursei]|uniref:3-methyladenine DNA glycosylase n=1 Tax=Streptomyces noursei TaxID=1971 RepID=A0A2N8PR54_STRNR|nr:hypothetical protein [Streptomyces noursei]PNE43516.1 hypothetical protein AOB60_01025 [Streptomyces noursei]